MGRIFFALILFAAVIAQVTILPKLIRIEVIPDLSLVLLLVWSALRGIPEALLWTFLLGVLIDVVALDPLGTNALALLVVTLLGGVARQRFFRATLLFPILLTVVATFVHAVVLLMLRSGSGAGEPFEAVIRIVVLQALLNSVLVPPVYWVAGLVNRRMVDSHA